MFRSAGCVLLSFVAAFVLASPATADEAEKPADGRGAAELFKQLDTNTDGQLSTDEVQGDRERLFKRLVRTADLNSDGLLSAEEFADGLSDDQQLPVIESGKVTAEKPKRAREPGAMLLRLDANGDGKVEFSEVPAARRKLFKEILDRADANHDGALDRKEAAKLGPPPGERSKPGANFDVDQLVKQALGKDQNSDSRLSRQEAPKYLQKAFAKIDANGDGQLDAEELKARFVSAQKKQRAKPDKSKKSDKPAK